jgi:Tol biopolymer transport system component
MHGRVDVYLAELKEEGTRLDSPTRLTVSDSEDYPTGWTPDSKTVLFSSDRIGRSQIFKQQTLLLASGLQRKQRLAAGELLTSQPRQPRDDQGRSS